MRKENRQADPFLLIFPWGKVTFLVIGMLFFAFFVYRLSQIGGLESSRACLSAFVTAGFAGGTGLIVVSKTWRRDVYFILAGVMIAMAIRLLISGGGVAIIMHFTDIHRSWFVLYLAVYYIAFLVVDTWLAYWILRNSDLNDQEKARHGNLWDLIS